MQGFDVLTGETRKLAVTLSAEAEDAPNFYRIGVHDVTAGALGAIDAVETAGAELARIARDGDISDALKASRLADGLARVETASKAHLETATTALGSLKMELDKRLIPARPEGVSDAVILDRKADLSAILDKAATPEVASEKALELARAALSEGDTLTHHALAGGPMRFYFERRGIDREALAERFAAVNPSPVAKLLPQFKGAKGIPAVVTMATNAVDMNLRNLRETYQPTVELLKARAAKAVPIR